MKIGVIAVGSAVGLLMSVSAWAVPPNAQCLYPDAAAVAAAVDQACPCDGQMDQTGQLVPWRNHGQHQRCVVKMRNQLRRQGCPVAGIARCAARSTCGKPNRILCCRVTTGTCDGTSLTCSNDATRTCATDADCTVLKGPKVRTADVCTAHGGYVSGTGSVCAGCQAPVACCVPSADGLSSTCQILTGSDCATQGGTPTGTLPSCDPSPCQ